MTPLLRAAWPGIVTASLLLMLIAPASADHPFVGAQTCATTGCHGRLHDSGSAPTLTEFEAWLSKDPHARAYSALVSDEGERILSNLLGRHFSPTDPVAVAAWTNCLQCHNTTADAPRGPAFRASVTEGVGCEACHGPAADWKPVHHSPAFHARSTSEKSALGLRDLSQPAIRVQVCVDCHVAGRGVVDHDLIAAGHPALKFEQTAYFAALPPHWKQDSPEIEAKRKSLDWLTGQIATARAAIGVSAKSMNSDHPRQIDLAEHDCAGCHHQLSAGLQTAVSSRIEPKRRLPEWGTWNLGLLELAASEPGAGAPPGTSAALTDLRLAMQDRFSQPPSELRDRLNAVDRLLAQWPLQSEPASLTAGLRHVARQSAAPSDGDPPMDWDRSVQLLYLLKALAPESGALSPLERELQFPNFQRRAADANYRREVRSLLQSAATELPE